MEIRDIRDKILREQARYEQSLERSKQTVESMKQTLGKITEEQIEVCKQYGVDLSPILNVNLERMTTDTSYRESCMQTQENLIAQLHSVLEGALNV